MIGDAKRDEERVRDRPAPITAARMTSRIKPVSLETSVHPPTEIIFLSIGQARRKRGSSWTSELLTSAAVPTRSATT